jgi:hypothetical protein
MEKFFKKYKDFLISVEKLYSIRKQAQDDTEFFENFFIHLWWKFGNQHIINFNRVWKWISNLNIRKEYVRSIDNKGKYIPLFRCMTMEEFVSMKDGRIKSPSWSIHYNKVTHFKSHQIQTKSTLKSIIVISLFDYDDILHICDNQEGECFLKYNTIPIKTEILVEWGVEDVERVHGHKIDLLYVSHNDCGNGFNLTDAILKRGLKLEGWTKLENGAWYSETDFKIKNGFDKINSIIDDWNKDLVTDGLNCEEDISLTTMLI